MSPEREALFDMLITANRESKSTMKSAYQEMQQAEKNSLHLYCLLLDAIRDKKYQVGQPYNGLQIVTVWDAKPIAYRPATFLQYEFTSLQTVDAQVIRADWGEVDDVLHDYFEAYGIASKARSKFHALYTQAVLDWMKDPGSRDDVLRNPDTLGTVVLREYEVKPVK